MSRWIVILLAMCVAAIGGYLIGHHGHGGVDDPYAVSVANEVRNRLRQRHPASRLDIVSAGCRNVTGRDTRHAIKYLRCIVTVGRGATYAVVVYAYRLVLDVDGCWQSTLSWARLVDTPNTSKTRAAWRRDGDINGGCTV